MLKKIMLKFKGFILLLLSKILLVQTLIILGIVYFLVLAPTAILAKFFGKDFLKEKKAAKSFWADRKKIKPTLEWAERPY